jgi:hypothetical protein
VGIHPAACKRGQDNHNIDNSLYGRSRSAVCSIGADITKLQISDLHNTLADLGIDPQLLAAGLILASPVAGMLAVIAYFLANFCLRTLEKMIGEKHGSATYVGVKER